MTNPEVTKEQFKSYVGIRDSGVTNMFDVQTVCELSGILDRKDCIYIMKNFSELAEYYNVEI